MSDRTASVIMWSMFLSGISLGMSIMALIHHLKGGQP